eukprot:GILK01008677.1.p1 GENE.GILK01008677.1~~GILK01008677.1.p1  ORF type:complete len:146 (-),score=12.86 GILK01008677.1:142-579(-)
MSNVYSSFHQLLVHFHNHFRDGIERLVQHAQNVSPATAQSFRRQIGDYISTLNLHHSIEDARIFPIVGKKLDISQLEADHHELEDIIQKLQHLISSSPFDASKAASFVEQLRPLVLQHMKLEEEMLSPASLQGVLSEAEVRSFTH